MEGSWWRGLEWTVSQTRSPQTKGASALPSAGWSLWASGLRRGHSLSFPDPW